MLGAAGAGGQRPTPIQEEPGSGVEGQGGGGVEQLTVTWVEVGTDGPVGEMDVRRLAPERVVVASASGGQRSPMKRAFSLTRSASKGKKDKEGGKLGRASSERL